MISVIINTKNEEKNIGRCLRSLDNQTNKNFEVIVVDNNSTDETQSIARKYGAKVFNFGPERSEQKNFAVGEARGEYLLFLDADMEADIRVLESCLKKIDEGFTSLVIPEISVGMGFWARCRALEKKMYFNDSEIEAPRFFRKDSFKEVGGYSPGMIAGEDWDLRERIKKTRMSIGRIDALIYHHEGRVNLFGALKKKFYYGKNSQVYLSKNPLNLVRVLKFLIRPSYWRNIGYFFIDPAHFLGIFFMKSLEFGAGFVGIIYAKLI